MISEMKYVFVFCLKKVTLFKILLNPMFFIKKINVMKEVLQISFEIQMCRYDREEMSSAIQFEFDE